MTRNNKVVWSEGMFLQPQHFQQQERYLESFVNSRTNFFASNQWGVFELKINAEALLLGNIAIDSCRGILRDGTVFDIPHADDVPHPLVIPQGTSDEIVYLALPLSCQNRSDIANEDNSMDAARYSATECTVENTASHANSFAQLQIGKLRLRIKLGSSDLSGYSCLGILKIKEIRANNQVILHEQYIPPCININASTSLLNYAKEIHGLLHNRSTLLASRMLTAKQHGVAETADFMLLQVANRYLPILSFYIDKLALSPETLYFTLIQIMGELATFDHKSRSFNMAISYRHEDLWGSFEPILHELRKCLSMILEQNAITLNLEERNYGMWVSSAIDKKLLGVADFILAVKADISPEAIRSTFPSQTKIGPLEQVSEYVNHALPGIELLPLTVVPRQIPYNTGATYFTLNRNSEIWHSFENSAGIAIHIGSDLPNLELEFWAIRD